MAYGDSISYGSSGTDNVLDCQGRGQTVFWMVLARLPVLAAEGLYGPHKVLRGQSLKSLNFKGKPSKAL